MDKLHHRYTCRMSKTAMAGLLMLLLSAFVISCRKSDYIIDETETIRDLGGGTGTTTWTSDKNYLIGGFVFVNDGQTLTIEAGTVIRARTGQGTLASALIVARGGKIIAQGTQTDPIIFTVEGDDLEGSVPVEARGLWGGLIILGNATINTESGEDMIEGIPISEPRGVYGGYDDDDNSGILQYVSIRHGGTNIGEGNEINGLTLGGVGRQTIIDHVEVISNADDGVEVFGGAVNLSSMAVSFCGDDAFDLDQGYHGKGQFWLGINSPDSDKCAEITGGLEPVSALPGSLPSIFNATLIGRVPSTEEAGISFQSYGGAFINNSIFLYPGTGTSIRYTDAPGDSYSLFEDGKLALYNNILYPDEYPGPLLSCYSELGEDVSEQNAILSDSLEAWHSSYENPGLTAGEEGYRLLPPSTEFDKLAPYTSDWFEKVTYKGAFGSNNWIEGWTLLYESGYIVD